MKEISIKEKAKRYDKAYKVAENIHRFSSDIAEVKRIEQLFPELAESEDEKIRNSIIHLVEKSHEYGGYALHKDEAEKMLAWLEKQGEQKPAEEYNITGISSNKSQGKLGEIIKNLKHTWSEWDETMITDLSVIVHTYFSEISGIPFKYDLSEDKIRTWLKSLKDRVQPKQEWSEEDSPCYDDVCEILINLLHSETANINKNAVQKDLDWLNSLKEKYTWNPSEEDKEMLDFAIRAVGLCKQYAINHQVNGYLNLPDVPKKYEELQDWLKTLRPQTTWKPSDAQMDSITCAVRKMKESACYDSELVSLHQDLKKLKEE